MKLIVGLGNPGPQYNNTRHNIGATMVEKFVKREQLGELKYDNKYKAEFLTFLWNKEGGETEQVLFANPQTYMNASGDAVTLLANFYKITPKEILVLHDEIELPLGKIALKSGGGAAGHNGLRSITTKLASPDFMRLRIGVGKASNIGVAEYVLQPFKPNEWEVLEGKEEEIFGFMREFLKK